MDSISIRIRWLVIAVIVTRAGYSWWIIAATFLARAGEHGALGLSPDYTNALLGLDDVQLCTWIVYVSGYSLTAILVFFRHPLSVPLAIISASLDIGLWVLTTGDPDLFHLSQVAGAGFENLRDLAFNVAAIMIVGGVLMLNQRGAFRR
jgi:hypothetical protein